MDTNHNDIYKTLGRIEGGIEGILNQLKAQNGRIGKLEDKVVSIEISDGKQNVKLGVVASAAGALGGFLLSFFKP